MFQKINNDYKLLTQENQESYSPRVNHKSVFISSALSNFNNYQENQYEPQSARIKNSNRLSSHDRFFPILNQQNDEPHFINSVSPQKKSRYQLEQELNAYQSNRSPQANDILDYFKNQQKKQQDEEKQKLEYKSQHDNLENQLNQQKMSQYIQFNQQIIQPLQKNQSSAQILLQQNLQPYQLQPKNQGDISPRKKPRNKIQKNQNVELTGFYLQIDSLYPLDSDVKQIQINYSLFILNEQISGVKNIKTEGNLQIINKTGEINQDNHIEKNFFDSEVQIYFQVYLEHTDESSQVFWTYFNIYDEDCNFQSGTFGLPVYFKQLAHAFRQDLKLQIRIFQTDYYMKSSKNVDPIQIAIPDYVVPNYHSAKHIISVEMKNYFNQNQQGFPNLVPVAQKKKKQKIVFKSDAINNIPQQEFLQKILSHQIKVGNIQQQREIDEYDQEKSKNKKKRQKENVIDKDYDFRAVQPELQCPVAWESEKIIYYPLEAVDCEESSQKLIEKLQTDNIYKFMQETGKNEYFIVFNLKNCQEFNVKGFSLQIQIQYKQKIIVDRSGQQQCLITQKVFQTQPNIFAFNITPAYLATIVKEYKLILILLELLDDKLKRVGDIVQIPLYKADKEINIGQAFPLQFTKVYKATIDLNLEQSIDQYKSQILVEKELSLISITLRKMEDYRDKLPIKIQLELISSRGLMKYKNGVCLINAEGQYVYPNTKQKAIQFSDVISFKIKKAKLLTIQKEILIIFKFLQKTSGKQQVDQEYGWLFFNLFKNGKIQVGQFLKYAYKPPIQERLPFVADRIMEGYSNFEFEINEEIIKEEKVIKKENFNKLENEDLSISWDENFIESDIDDDEDDDIDQDDELDNNLQNKNIQQQKKN